MAQSRSFLEDVKRELVCSVCKDQFSEIKEPKILKCLHTFCKSCLEAWLRQQREGAALSCPTCRQITECPNNNINSLPSNLFYKQMVEIVEAYSGQGQAYSPHCGNCSERKSLKFYCPDCNFFLCEDCAGLHKKWKDFSDHHVKEIGNFESSDARDYARRANFCKQHKDEVRLRCRFYCEQCVLCICHECVILDHRDHKIVSIEQGIEKKKSEIETKIREVQVNGDRLRKHKESVEKRRVKINKSIEEATDEAHKVAERCILLIRQHEASVTERLTKEKATIQNAFVNQLSGLDGKLAEIDNSLAFSEEVLVRENLPEILNVKGMIEQRLKELSTTFKFMPILDYSEVTYIPNDVSFLKDAPGKLVTTKTEPSLSVAVGNGLTEGLQGEDCTFTIITRDARGQETYSEIDKVDVEIGSVVQQNNDTIKPVIKDTKDGHYIVRYRPNTAGEFTVSIKVTGNPIIGSPFKLIVKTVSKSKMKSRQSWTAGTAKGSTFGFHRMSSGASVTGGDDKYHKLVSFSLDFPPAVTKKKNDSCPICLETLTSPRVLKCKDVFCDACLKKALDVCNRCPVCFEAQGVLHGNQPPGQMESRFDRFQGLPGYEAYGTIIIEYKFPPGIQGHDHPNPGVRFQGASWTTFLPDTQEGRDVLKLLKKAFDARLVFTVGPSNRITWNGIRYKSSRFGNPDTDHLCQVKIDLAAKGIH